jgi:hypothetical protein
LRTHFRVWLFIEDFALAHELAEEPVLFFQAAADFVRVAD